ncbi:MAG TPA: RNA polymerase sigma factor [Steroidobacteraceae bacterium]|nr:RNA polymerase sigma factor [Steroidobacteraceae bacterium]
MTQPMAADDGDGSDESLMLAYGLGDPLAFDRLYARHRGPVFRYLLRHLGERAVAEELHQEVWLRVVRGRSTYEASAKFTTWLYTVARSRLVDHWRASRHARLLSLDVDDSETPLEPVSDRDQTGHDDPLEAAVRTQTGMRLQDALAALPPAQRDAFLLHIEAGLAIAEIAALAGVGEETVKSRLRYAYARLRRTLGVAT